VNIRDLKYLVAIADYGHFGRAAQACFVSQPGLSMQIKKLESTLGVQLIERTNKSILLTEAGKLITEHARDILHKVENMKIAAKQANDPYCGELRLGVIPTVAPYLLPHIIPKLAKAYPKLMLYLIEEQTSRLVEKLKQGKIDCALLALPFTHEDFSALPLFEEEFMLAVPSNHALSKKKNASLSDLENKTLLLLEDGHCMRDAALELCYRTKATEAKNFRASSLETLRHMVAAKAGITLIPKLAHKLNDGICYLTFNAPKPARTIGMVWRPSTSRKILLESLVEDIRKIMNKHVKVISTSIPCHKTYR